jgi:hypothetical protein
MVFITSCYFGIVKKDIDHMLPIGMFFECCGNGEVHRNFISLLSPLDECKVSMQLQQE